MYFVLCVPTDAESGETVERSVVNFVYFVYFNLLSHRGSL